VELLEVYTQHTHTYDDMYAWSHALGLRGCGIGPWVRKCVNVPRIMRLDAPSFISIYLTISTLVVGHETKGIILKAGSVTYPFGGKVY
jgi:hypothetical protein